MMQVVAVVCWKSLSPFFHFLFSVHCCTEELVEGRAELSRVELVWNRGLFGNQTVWGILHVYF